MLSFVLFLLVTSALSEWVAESEVHPLVIQSLKEDLAASAASAASATAVVATQEETAITGIEGSEYEPPALGAESFRWVYDRGIGTIPTNCKSGHKKDSVLQICMEQCKSGYKIQLLARWDCAEKCPSGYVETTSRLCTKTSLKTCKLSCSKPKCKWKKWKLRCSAPSCSATCPSGYKNIACVCTRIQTKGRKKYVRKSSPWECPSNKRNEAGLCYKPCDKGYTGVGSLCTYTEWFKILKNLVKNCNPFDKNFDLLTCLEYVGDLTMDMIKLLAKLMSLLEKAIDWLLSKLTFLKKATDFVEKLMRDILFSPINDCRASTGFEFNSPDFFDIIDQVQGIVQDKTFDSSYVNKFMPNFIPFMNCLKNKVMTLIENLGKTMKVADFVKFMKMSHQRRRRMLTTLKDVFKASDKVADTILSAFPWNLDCPTYSKCVPKKIRNNLKDYFITNPTLEFNIQASSTPLFLSFNVRWGIYDSYISARIRIGPTAMDAFGKYLPGLTQELTGKTAWKYLTKQKIKQHFNTLKGHHKWYFDGVIMNFYRDWHYQYPWHKHLFSFPFPLGMLWQFITGRLPKGNPVRELFQKEDVLFIHLGVNRPCQDKFFGKWSTPVLTMSGFGMVVPLKLFGFNNFRRYATPQFSKSQYNAVFMKPTCGEREFFCAASIREWNEWISRGKMTEEQRRICDRRTSVLKKLYFKCSHFEKVRYWYSYLKNQKNSLLGAVLGQFWIRKECGSGYCAIFPILGTVGNCKIELGETGGSEVMNEYASTPLVGEEMSEEIDATAFEAYSSTTTTAICGIGLALFGVTAFILKRIRNKSYLDANSFEQIPDMV